MNAFVQLISLLANILTLLIISDALLSFFVSPLHPIREALGRILHPLYAPIRKIVPPLGMMDFTPIILILLIQVLEVILVSAFT